jgi:hypothetical protein
MVAESVECSRAVNGHPVSAGSPELQVAVPVREKFFGYTS